MILQRLACMFFLFLFTFINSFAQNFNAIIHEADKLEAIPNEKGAFQKFKEALKIQPVNLYALTKCSELSSRIAAREPDIKSRNSYNEAAIIYAKTALKFFPNSDEANVAMGIAVGRTLLTKSGKEKISLVKDIKHYADNALKFNPNNFKAWHILGKWNYEISNLSMMERAATRIFYGGLPAASLKSSIAAYEKARKLNPNFSLNYLELAKAYKKNNDKAKAVAVLKIMMPLPVQTEDDPRIKKEAAFLIKDWE